MLALLLGTGTRGISALGLAREVLAGMGPEPLEALGRARPEELVQVTGLGPAKAARLLAACELGRRVGAWRVPARPRVTGPEDLVRQVRRQLQHAEREAAMVAWLDARQRVLGWEAVSIGSLTETIVHPREVFREAIRKGAWGIALVHNHPSGDPVPSEADRELTRRLFEVGELVGIPLVDHLIVGAEGFYSFRSEPALWTNRAARGPTT